MDTNRLKSLVFFLTLYIFLPGSVLAKEFVSPKGSFEEKQYEAEIVKVVKEEVRTTYGTKHVYQQFIVEVLDTRKRVTVESGKLPITGVPIYKEGDKVIIGELAHTDGQVVITVLDYVRRDTLYLLFFLFVAVSFLIARRKAIQSLIGLGYSFLIIFKIVLPLILSGTNPVFAALLGGVLIIPITFYLSHGFNKKTHVSILGTITALGVTGILAFIFVAASHLTGYSSEEASFLQGVLKGPVQMQSLLLAGIIIGLYGILDDITISQASIVEKLHEVSPDMTSLQLYTKALDVGKDHIASVINTLILVYAGAALPFLLLFVGSDQSFQQALNLQIIAEEIVRMLTSSIGLILAVPLTTFLAALSYKKR